MIRFLSVVGLVAVSAVAYLYKKGCEVSKKEEGYNGAETELEKK